MLWRAHLGHITGRSAMDPAPVVPTWHTAASTTLSTDSTGWNGFNVRQRISASVLAFSGTKVRVTLQAANTGGFTIDHAAIGHAAAAGDAYDFDGGQIVLTFSGGSAGVTVASAGTVLSDEMVFAFDKTKNFIIAVHFSAASAVRSVGAATGWTGYYKSAASEVLTADVSTYTTGNPAYLVNLVEVFS